MHARLPTALRTETSGMHARLEVALHRGEGEVARLRCQRRARLYVRVVLSPPAAGRPVAVPARQAAPELLLAAIVPVEPQKAVCLLAH